MMSGSISVKEEQAVELHTMDAESAPDAGLRLRSITVGEAVAGTVLIVAALMRLYALGSRPLGAEEAGRALLALRYVQGQAAELTGFSPLLANLNLLVFFLAGASDFWARLVPALFGIVLVALPVVRFRHRLGAGGALSAAVLLTISPTFLLFSRSAAPAVLTAVTSLLFVGAVFDYADYGGRRHLLFAAGALALALTAGPGTYVMLLFLLLFGIGAWLSYRDIDSAGWNRIATAVWRLRVDREGAIRAGAVFLATFIVAATGFLVNFGGIQAALNLFVEWLRSFSLTSEYPFWYYAGVLLLYEPAIVVFGLLGAVLAVRRRDSLQVFLVTWFLGGFALYTLIGATEPSFIIPILLPLALLAGRGMASALNFRSTNETARGLLVAAFTVPSMVYIVVQLAFYAETTTDPVNLLLALGAAVLAVGIAVVFASSQFGMGWQPATVGRGVGISMLLLSVGLTLHMGSQLNFIEHEPVRELLLIDPTSPDAHEMVTMLETLSQDRVGDTVSMPITVDGRVAPVVSWYLRDFTNTTIVDEIRQPPQTPVVIMPAIDQMPPIGEQYIGQSFRISSRWRLTDLTASDVVRWYFYRKGPSSPYNEIIVYVIQQ